MKKILILAAAIAAILWGHATLSQVAPVSTRLTDTIRQGVGNINLLNSRDGMNPALLEAFRSDNNGQLAFAVDVNENSSGLESSKSQGVSIASASVVVTFPGNVSKTYTQYSTETQALIAPQGSTTRNTYYTLLGDAGSSSITPRRISNQDFDSTLKIRIPDDLSSALTAVLRVQFLTTNPSYGDPENFYDFNGGYEDVAIITRATARYLDEVLPYSTDAVFRKLAPAVQLSPEGTTTQQTLLAAATNTSTPSTSQILSGSTSLSWVQSPGASSYNIVAYEDLYPSRGDYDFNDAVVAYRYELGINASGMIERVDGVAYLVARGSNYTHNWSLDIPLPAVAASASPQCSTQLADTTTAACAITVGQGKLSWTAFADTRTLLPPASASSAPQRNTLSGVANVRGPKATFSFVFDTPIALSDWGTDDPWLYVVDTSQSIHYATKDANGFPFALNLPSAWQIPQEGVDMGLVYPFFANFVQSSGTQSTDWYLKPDTSRSIAWGVSDWSW